MANDEIDLRAYEQRLAMPSAPKSLIAIAWLSILLGGSQALLNVLNLLGALTLTSALRGMGASDEQASSFWHGAPFIFFLAVVFDLVALASGVGGVVGGIGLLRRREWGRKFAEWAWWGELLTLTMWGYFLLTSAAETRRWEFEVDYVSSLVALVPFACVVALIIRALRGSSVRQSIAYAAWSESPPRVK